MTTEMPDEFDEPEVPLAEMPEGPKELRAAYERERDGRVAAEAKLLSQAFSQAGYNQAEGVGKLLAIAYTGEPDAEAIKAFAAEHGIGEAPPPAAVKPTVDQAQERVDAALTGGTSVPPITLADQIRQAEADGDWGKSLTLKAQHLGAISQS